MNVNNENYMLDPVGADVSLILEDEDILSRNGRKNESSISETTALLSSEDNNLHSQIPFNGHNQTVNSDSESQLLFSQFCLQNRDHRNSSINTISDDTIEKLNIDEDFLDLPIGKKYHLYVSYSSDDSTEVKTICGQIEKRFYLKCLNYDRDFTPGKRIDENIYDEMTQSVAVLIVLSPNYVASLWCMTEAQHALNLSFKSRNHLKVIPILIRTPDEELPPLLKSHRYIDARNLADIPAKIYEVYCYPAANKLDCIEQTVDNSRQNGATMWYLVADRDLHFCGKVYTYEFSALTENKVQKISAYSPNCEEQVRTAISYVNSHTFMKYYRIFNSPKCSRVACFLVLILTALIPLAIGSFIITLRRDTSGPTGLVLLYVGAGIVSIASSCVYQCVLNKVKKKLLINLRTGIWKINNEYFESTKCVVEFITYTNYPSLEGTRYDTSKCKERLCSLLETKQESYNKERIKVYVDTRIKEMLKVLQLKGFRNVWLLEECEFNIHNTWKNRKCLCQIIEKSLHEMRK